MKQFNFKFHVTIHRNITLEKNDIIKLNYKNVIRSFSCNATSKYL